jgi:soluble lytic murein transglycosylase-like protein
MQALTPIQMQCLPLIQQAIGFKGWYKPAWMKPSWIMATIRIESGWVPTVVNGTGREDGLMQVIPGTAMAMNSQYKLGLTLPQTDPWTSILSGVAYYDATVRYLLKAWNAAEIPLSAVIEGYNEGYGTVASGKMVSNYWLKWAAAQQGYAFVDTAALIALA